MRRREFIAGLGCAAWPLLARAQQGERVRRVGVLYYGGEIVGLTPVRTTLTDDLEKLGWVEGRNLQLDFRFGFGDAAKARILAADLVQLSPNLSRWQLAIGSPQFTRTEGRRRPAGL
jgi:putative tryptophan/tyrosine transport system substrate-binding protein